MNSFLHPVSEVHFDQYRTEDVEEALTSTGQEAWTRIDAALAVADAERTFDNTILAIERSAESFAMVVGLVMHLESLLGEAWGPAAELANERQVAFSNRVSFNKPVYEAYRIVRGQESSKELSAPKQKLLDDRILSYERGGINLPEAEQKRLINLKERLSKAEHAFGVNVVKATDEAGLHIKTEAELAGLSQEFIAECRQHAIDRKLDGYWIDSNPPVNQYVMSNCSVASTRQALYRMNSERAASTNTTIATEILTLRREMAGILGYDDWSDFVLAQRMAKTGQRATTFVEELIAKYRHQADQEAAELQQFVDSLPEAGGYRLDISDLDSSGSYYSAKLRARQVGIDEEALKAYFSLDNVLNEMFTTLRTLYGIEIRRVDGVTWHPDVEIYELHDDGHHLATVWCDWYARNGKRGGAWANVFYVADRDKGNFERPHLGTVVANFESPKDGRCRMTQRDVETVWHEFGHFIHFAVGTTELIEQSSFECRWDFVEAPSQIMENWVWQPEVLRRLARHETTGETLSDELIAKLQAARTFQVGLGAMRQLYFALSDLKLHREYLPDRDGDINAYVRAIKQSLQPLPVYPNDAFPTLFLHIFSGGYSAAYYSYKWAEVIEADFFERFQREGILSPEVGRDYRSKVLARGSEVEPDVLIEDFLGRPATPEAMLRRDGVETR